MDKNNVVIQEFWVTICVVIGPVYWYLLRAALKEIKAFFDESFPVVFNLASLFCNYKDFEISYYYANTYRS